MITNNSKNSRFKETKQAHFDALVSRYYDWILEYNKESGLIEFLHISDAFLDKGILPEKIHTFQELNQFFADEMVVQEEHDAYLEQLALPCILKEIENLDCYVRTVHINTSDGIRAESLRITPMQDSSSFLVSLTDITMVLDRDWMTDEYSRSGFISKLEQLLKEPQYQKGYSVIYTNIKGFKAINDIIGTQRCDIIIFQARDSILKELNPVLMARLENDHFAIFTKTENITDETMDRFCHPSYVDENTRLSYQIRCGVFNVDSHINKVTYMLDRAKIAEKAIPNNQAIPYAICNEKQTQDYINHRFYVSELDSSLKKGEFKAYYQPIVDAKTYEIVSAEALIRWFHSEKGFISPGEFIPVFEKEGLTSKIATFMINSILDFNNSRLENGKKSIPCSVNLSRVDFYDTNLMELLKQLLKNQKNVSKMLKLEITESAYATLEAGAFSFLEEMHKLGLDVLLDDFGNGMSSLSTLEFYDFDVIKLDMGFIRRIGKNPKTEAIIKHTIGLSHAMGAKVVAEGVETKEQLEFLQSADCDMIQGYYFYKPMQAEEFEKLI